MITKRDKLLSGSALLNLAILWRDDLARAQLKATHLSLGIKPFALNLVVCDLQEWEKLQGRELEHT